MKKIILVSALVLMSSRAMAVVDHPAAWFGMSTGMSSLALAYPIRLPAEGSAYAIGYSMDGENGAELAKGKARKVFGSGLLAVSQMPLAPFYLSSGFNSGDLSDMYSGGLGDLSSRKEALEEIDDPKLEPEEPIVIEESIEGVPLEKNPEAGELQEREVRLGAEFF